MDLIFKVCGLFLFVVLVWHFLTKKYINPYKLYMVVGKKGSGKTTLLIRLAYEHIRKGWTVYSTERIPGCYHIDYSDIGKYDLPSGSVLLVDEVGMIWDARKFKDFPDHLRDWFKYQRHEGVRSIFSVRHSMLTKRFVTLQIICIWLPMLLVSLHTVNVLSKSRIWSNLQLKVPLALMMF